MASLPYFADLYNPVKNSKKANLKKETELLIKILALTSDTFIGFIKSYKKAKYIDINNFSYILLEIQDLHGESEFTSRKISPTQVPLKFFGK